MHKSEQNAFNRKIEEYAIQELQWYLTSTISLRNSVISYCMLTRFESWRIYHDVLRALQYCAIYKFYSKLNFANIGNYISVT